MEQDECRGLLLLKVYHAFLKLVSKLDSSLPFSSLEAAD